MTDTTKQISLNLLPEKSKESIYQKFLNWKTDKEISKDVLLVFFDEMSVNRKLLSLWSLSIDSLKPSMVLKRVQKYD